MEITRRQWTQLAFRSAAAGALGLHEIPSWAQTPLPGVPFQPFAAATERLLRALSSLGTPLPSAEDASIRQALNASAAQQSTAIEAIQAALAPHVLINVEINPEMRVAVSRGSAIANSCRAAGAHSSCASATPPAQRPCSPSDRHRPTR